MANRLTKGTGLFGKLVAIDLTLAGFLFGSTTNSITAFAGGGQGSAVALTTGYNRITVCATAADSVKLPAATAGKEVKIKNNGAAYASVFPATGEVIDTLAANTSVSLPAGGTISFYCVVAGTWESSKLHPVPKYSTGTTTTTFAAGQLTGGSEVTYRSTAGTPGTITTRTAAQMFTDDPYARVGGTYMLRIGNTAAGSATMTIAAGSGVTLTGTATVSDTYVSIFMVTYTSATALTMQYVGSEVTA